MIISIRFVDAVENYFSTVVLCQVACLCSSMCFMGFAAIKVCITVTSRLCVRSVNLILSVKQL